jgi:hypothetical protein
MAAATERVVLLMSPEEKACLANMARQAGTSVGEFVRRLVRERVSDIELAAEIEGRRCEFEALVSELENSTTRAHAAWDAALDEAERTRRHFRKGRAERVAS